MVFCLYKHHTRNNGRILYDDSKKCKLLSDRGGHYVNSGAMDSCSFAPDYIEDIVKIFQRNC